jgi:hypothetical protein
MEGVRQYQLNLWQISDIFRIFEYIENHSLDSRLSAYRHENRCRQGDSIEDDLSDSRMSLLFEYLEVELVHEKKEK